MSDRRKHRLIECNPSWVAAITAIACGLAALFILWVLTW